jgi:hypothetical protein
MSRNSFAVDHTHSLNGDYGNKQNKSLNAGINNISVSTFIGSQSVDEFSSTMKKSTFSSISIPQKQLQKSYNNIDIA